MNFVDRELTCQDCGARFTFEAREQDFFMQKGFINDPKRCPECRRARKAERGGSEFSGTGRRMYPATCAACGVETEVPFLPREGRPVYCSACFGSIGANTRRR